MTDTALPTSSRPERRDAVAVGAIARRSRTVRREDIELFTQLTGDRNPLHYDEAAAADSRFGEIIVQGGITSAILNAVVAEKLPGPGTVFRRHWKTVAAVICRTLRRSDAAADRSVAHPCRIRRMDAIDRQRIDGRQLVRVQLAYRALDGVVLRVDGLQQQAKFVVDLQGTVPVVKALDRRDLRAGGETALDQRLRDAPGVVAAGDGGDDGDAIHPMNRRCDPAVRSGSRAASA